MSWNLHAVSSASFLAFSAGENPAMRRAESGLQTTSSGPVVRYRGTWPRPDGKTVSRSACPEATVGDRASARATAATATVRREGRGRIRLSIPPEVASVTPLLPAPPRAGAIIKDPVPGQFRHEQ